MGAKAVHRRGCRGSPIVGFAAVLVPELVLIRELDRRRGAGTRKACGERIRRAERESGYNAAWAGYGGEVRGVPNPATARGRSHTASAGRACATFPRPWPPRTPPPPVLPLPPPHAPLRRPRERGSKGEKGG